MKVSRVLLESPPSGANNPEKQEGRLCMRKSFSWNTKCVKDTACDCVSPEIVETVCIRYDFDKNIQVPSAPTSLFTEATPLLSFMGRRRKESNFNNNLNEPGGAVNGNTLYKHNGSLKSETSPESRKRELYSYLKLMDPAERKNSPKIVNRRTLRTRQIKAGNSTKTSTPSLREYVQNKFMPLPSQEVYNQQVDFEEAIQHLVCDLALPEPKKIIKKRRKLKFDFQSRINLRSRRRLKHISLDRIIIRASHIRKRARRKLLVRKRKSIINPLKTIPENDQENVEVDTTCIPLTKLPENDQENVKIISECVLPTKIDNLQCDIRINKNPSRENIDLKNFVDDMLELDKMSEEHKKSVIESRILTSSAITNFIAKSTNQEENVQKAFKIFSDLSNEHMLNTSEETQGNESITETIVQDDIEVENYEFEVPIEEGSSSCSDVNVNNDLVILEHDYATMNNPDDETDDEAEDLHSCVSLSPLPILDLEVLPLKPVMEVKSLQRSLVIKPRRKRLSNSYLQDWDSKMEHNNLKHSIEINIKNGKVLRAFYQDYNLVVVQQASVSFWTQSALGNVLGAQNMWVPKGNTPRILLNDSYCQKDAKEMVISNETSLAYIELWTKEHKSDVREVPVADVFVTVYFWRLRQNGLEKKALQLENIKGIADDVQYCVLKSFSKIIVSWYSGRGNEKKTKIHSYHLAADFQTVASISEIQAVEHFVTSLHNIEGEQ